jgi:hypothetical protein
MKDEDIDKRHASAYHVAGQAVMAFYLGGSVNDEGVEIDERRYCGYPFLSSTMLRRRNASCCYVDLAGWRAEHLWQGIGSSRDGFAVLEDCRQGWDDDADAVDAMLKMSPSATDDELAQR